MYNWLDCKSPQELIEFLEQRNYASIDKWTVFRYYACSKNAKDHEFFLKLLNSPFFPVVEVLEKYNSRIFNFTNNESVEEISSSVIKAYNEGTDEEKARIEATPSGWKFIKDPKILENLVNYGTGFDRWTIFKHYAKSSRPEDQKLFSMLLDRCFVSPDSVAKSLAKNSVNDIWPNKVNREKAQLYVEKHLKERYSGEEETRELYSVDLNVSELENTVAGRSKLYSHLKFFANYYPDNFSDLAARVSPNLIKDWFFSENSSEEGKKIAQNLCKNRKDIVLGLKVAMYQEKMGYDVKFIKSMRVDKAFSDWEFFRELATTKGTERALYNFLVLNVVDPSKVKEQFTEDEIRSFHKSVKRFVGEESWKYFSDPWFVTRMITTENEWDIFEFYLEKDKKVLNHLIKEVENYRPYKIYTHYNGKDLSSYSEKSIDFITKNINIIERLKERDRVRREEIKRLKENKNSPEFLRWIDKENDSLKVFFTIYKNRRLRSRSEYREFANAYIESGLTIKAFCSKFKINSEEGFSKMLHIVAEEDPEFCEKLNNLSAYNRKKFNMATQSMIENVVLGKLEVREFIIKLNQDSQALPNIMEYISYTYKNPKVGAIFVHRIASYYYERLNSYDGTIELDNLEKMLTNKEMGFVLGKSELINMKHNGKAEIDEVFYTPIKPYAQDLKNLFAAKINGRGNDKIRNRINFYNTAYRRNKTLNMIIGSCNLGTIKVTNEVLDLAEQYALDHDLFMCDATMTRIIRAIAEGKLKKEQVSCEKRGETEDIYEQARECSLVEDYIKTIESAEME